MFLYLQSTQKMQERNSLSDEVNFAVITGSIPQAKEVQKLTWEAHWHKEDAKPDSTEAIKTGMIP